MIKAVSKKQEVSKK